jgi:predicted phage terminase large subunit-like protein
MGPGVRFLNASHAGPLSIRDSMRTRRLMQGRWYRGNWGERVVFASDQNAKQRYENTAGGARIATSVGGQLIGEGGDIITIDDPHNTMAPESETQREEVLTWWFEGMSTRLNDQRTGAFVVIMQRLHERDLSGAILAREMGWDHLCLPMRYEPAHPHPVRSSLGFKDPRRTEGEMLWPERFPHEAVESLSTKLGAYGTAGQLQQRPTLREGGLFKRTWFKTVSAAPAGGRVVRCWDLAATADTRHDPDYTAGLRMKRTSDGRYFIEHVERFRGTPHQVERAIRNTAEQDPEGTRTIVPQDPGQAGKAQAQRLVSLLEGFDARARAESGTKDVRATPFAAQCEAGNVFLVKGPWNEAFIDEITTFPLGAHDDQVDAASGAFAELAQPVKRPWSQAM